MASHYNKSHNEKLANWHTWFAWYPVRLDTGEWKWITYVGRKLSISIDWTYDTSGQYDEYYVCNRSAYCDIDSVLVRRLSENYVELPTLDQY